MTHPTVDFVLNDRCIELDVYYTLMFFRNPDKSGDFSKKIRIQKQYPQLLQFDTTPEDEQDQFVTRILREEFHIEKNNIEAARFEIEEKWQSVGQLYFTEIEKVFQSHQWPIGDYRCYISIVDLNAIIKKELSFQLFYGLLEEEVTNAVITHEMTHFIFYDYIQKIPDINRQVQWEMAEIFNKFIQSSKRFEKFSYPTKKLLVSKQEKILEQISNNLNPETANIEGFLNYYLENFK